MSGLPGTFVPGPGTVKYCMQLTLSKCFEKIQAGEHLSYWYLATKYSVSKSELYSCITGDRYKGGTKQKPLPKDR